VVCAADARWFIVGDREVFQRSVFSKGGLFLSYPSFFLFCCLFSPGRSGRIGLPILSLSRCCFDSLEVPYPPLPLPLPDIFSTPPFCRTIRAPCHFSTVLTAFHLRNTRFQNLSHAHLFPPYNQHKSQSFSIILFVLRRSKLPLVVFSVCAGSERVFNVSSSLRTRV